MKRRECIPAGRWVSPVDIAYPISEGLLPVGRQAVFVGVEPGGVHGTAGTAPIGLKNARILEKQGCTDRARR